MNFQAIRTRLDALTEHDIGGIDLAVYVHGKPVFRHFAGFQNIEENIPISEKTLYRMFSMTKVITCTAALQLWEQGKYLLTDPVADYLPAFKDLRVRVPGSNETVPCKTVLRIHHLFEMTSGIDYNMNTHAIQELTRQTDCHFTTRQFAEAVAQNPLQFEPGSHYLYGLNHDVLGALIEIWSGQTLEAYCKEHIFAPLGMSTACFRESEIDKANLCVRYLTDESNQLVRTCQDNSLQPSDCCFSGGAGSTMTLDDYARFACAMTNCGLSMDGVRILAPRTVDMMRANRLHPEALRAYQTDNILRAGHGYGLGVSTLLEPAASNQLCSIGSFGWGGAWGTMVHMDPAYGVTLVYGIQRDTSLRPKVFYPLLNMVYAALSRQGVI